MINGNLYPDFIDFAVESMVLLNMPDTKSVTLLLSDLLKSLIHAV